MPTTPQPEPRDFLTVLDGGKRPAARAAAATVSDPQGYGAAALAGECDNVRAVAVGEGRNDQLNRSAAKLGSLVAAGLLDERTVTDALGDADGGLDYPATRATIASGLKFGMQQPRVITERPTSTDPFSDHFAAPSGTAAPAESAVPAEQPSRTSWALLDLAAIIAGQDSTTPAPVFLARQDGHRLFYGGRINGLIGESESGKTWVALHTVQRALAEGERVTFIDFEDTPQTIVGRLRALGATDKHLDRFAYMRPDEPLQAGTALADLDASLAEHRPALVVLDGFNEAMVLLGLEPLSNRDVTAFGQLLLRRITATGAGLVTVDHTGKQGGGKGALGAQAKRALVDGCTLRVEPIKPFGIGQSGQLRLGVDKDRPGHVRGNSTNGNAGTVVLAAQDEDGLIVVTVEPPGVASVASSFRPTTIMQKISQHLETMTTPQTSNAVYTAAGGTRAHARAALALLVIEGHVIATPGTNHSILHAIGRPYRQIDDPESDQYVERESAA